MADAPRPGERGREKRAAQNGSKMQNAVAEKSSSEGKRGVGLQHTQQAEVRKAARHHGVCTLHIDDGEALLFGKPTGFFNAPEVSSETKPLALKHRPRSA